MSTAKTWTLSSPFKDESPKTLMEASYQLSQCPDRESPKSPEGFLVLDLECQEQQSPAEESLSKQKQPSYRNRHVFSSEEALAPLCTTEVYCSTKL